MRWQVLLLSTALLFAGCVSSQSDPFPAGVDSARVEESPSESPPAGEEDTSPPPASDTTSTPPANETQEDDVPPPPPDAEPLPPSAWTRDATVGLGWGVALGFHEPVGMLYGEGDDTYCPRAGLPVPAGATRLFVSVAGAPIDPDAQGAGILIVDVAGPDGATASLSPVAAPEEAGAAIPPTTYELADPAAGAWQVSVRPLGPVVSQVVTVEWLVEGLSVDQPGFLEVARGPCE